MGSAFLIGALARLDEPDWRPDGDLGSWVQYGLGVVLAAAMIIVGLRVAIGEESGARRSVALLVGSLGAGILGLVLIAATVTR